jgi:ankyrin repeat protein
MLLDAGADVNAVSGSGWTSVMIAAREGHYDITKELLDRGAGIRLTRDMFSRRAMDLVTLYGMSGWTRFQDESIEKAKARYTTIHHLLLRYM